MWNNNRAKIVQQNKQNTIGDLIILFRSIILLLFHYCNILAYFLVHFHNLALQSPLPVAKIPSVPSEFNETATEITELR